MSAFNKTPFSIIYDSFFTRVTDDMYMEMTEADTYSQLQDLLINSISYFEFPKFDIFDYELGYLDESEEPATWVGGFFNTILSQEEINILSMYMVVEWFSIQLATTENTRMKYSSSDFKFTSQANHMAKLKVMIDSYKQNGLHLQRLYSRRTKSSSGSVQSTMNKLAGFKNDH